MLQHGCLCFLPRASALTGLQSSVCRLMSHSSPCIPGSSPHVPLSLHPCAECIFSHWVIRTRTLSVAVVTWLISGITAKTSSSEWAIRASQSVFCTAMTSSKLKWCCTVCSHGSFLLLSCTACTFLYAQKVRYVHLFYDDFLALKCLETQFSESLSRSWDPRALVSVLGLIVSVSVLRH